MYIAVRRGKNGSWALVQDRVPDTNDSGEIVPVGQMAELIPGLSVSIEEFELPGSRVIDLVGVDADGTITLALCRLAQSTEIRQACAARLLELAARLRREIPFREFEQRALLLKGRPLDQLVHDSLSGEERANFDPRAFRLQLAQNLEQGRFRLVLAVDDVCEEFGSMVEFLRDSSEGFIQFEPIEIRLFTCGEWQVMVPRYRPQSGPWTPGPATGTRSGPPLPLEIVDDADESRIDLDRFDDLYDYIRDEDGYSDSDEDVEADADADHFSEILMEVYGRQLAEEDFFEALSPNVTRDAVRRCRRLLKLGREPGGAMPAGWIVSPDALSFQVAHFREDEDGIEPVVVEIFRVDADGTLVFDIPLLRIMLSSQAVEGLLRDFSTNSGLFGALDRAADRASIPLEQAFPSDHDVRAFSVAIRRVVFGLGLAGEHGGHGGHGGREG